MEVAGLVVLFLVGTILIGIGINLVNPALPILGTLIYFLGYLLSK